VLERFPSPLALGDRTRRGRRAEAPRSRLVEGIARREKGGGPHVLNPYDEDEDGKNDIQVGGNGMRARELHMPGIGGGRGRGGEEGGAMLTYQLLVFVDLSNSPSGETFFHTDL